MKTMYYTELVTDDLSLFFEYPYLSNMLDVGWMLDIKR